MDVEALSVSEVEGTIGRCPHLKSFIDKNDKTPFTDGHIELYGDLPQSNSTRLGRVPVQVKGRSFVDLETQRQIHRISRTDLLAYLQDSGVLFFFVRIEKDTGKRAAYYANLAPFKIQSLLDRAEPEAKSIVVDLHRLPNAPAEIEAIVHLALRTRDQNPGAGLDPILLERAEGFTLYATSKPNFDGPIAIDLASGDFALVLHTTGGMAVPLSGALQFTPSDHNFHPWPHRVSSGATTYDEVKRRRLDRQTVELQLGDGVTLQLRQSPDGPALTASIRAEGNLAGRLRALEFMRSLSETGAIEVDGQRALLGRVTSEERTRSLEDVAEDLRRLAELFELLGVDAELVDLNEVSDDEYAGLDVIHKGLVRGEEIRNAELQQGFIFQPAGRWGLLVLAVAGSSPDRWQLVDPFSPDSRRQFRAQSDDEGSESYPVTPYEIIDREHLALILNLRLGSIVGAYEAIADWPTSTFGQANLRVLDLIAVSDTCEPRRQELLEAATALNEWLIGAQGAKPHHLINRWQIMYRRGLLTQEHRLEIRELKHQAPNDREQDLAQFIGVACAILLDESGEVDFLVSLLSQEDRATIQKWPIWAIHES